MPQKEIQLDDVLSMIRRLSEAEQKKLMNLLKTQKTGKGTRKLRELRGLGKEIWRGVDIEKYIDAERSSWEKSN